MNIRCDFLRSGSFPAVHQTFVDAFADYAIDMSYMSEGSFLNRAIKNGLDLGSSVGAFAGERMVGFTLVGIDDWKGARAAFDIATGIIPSYRGRAIARTMFDFSLPGLREKGVERFVLEVLQENEPAIRSYRKTGFEVVREFDCYQVSPQSALFDKRLDLPIEIQPLDRQRLDELASCLDWQPSWENSFASLKRIPDELLLFGACHDGDLIGALGYYPALGWVTTIVVDRRYRRHGVGTKLLRGLVERLERAATLIKVVNIERGDVALGAFLQRVGFAVYARQYEMEMPL